ncbi:beta-N-acetylhexosaminidase [Verrucomicrobiaceae bacterium 5K15]|uniref:beta-N-acetylhexosaminidase n=1 Tax=Oceaniferula flava TaxID=2800421 RepID=A0AAE2VC49_9BACT|nr:beta-N-acetylhexosaminidase [Oceaniferula flavus]MBK1854606.1 beta-N-acetylhexosaminidase [Oceaniferula flavus]MBM1135912.1 beta-N-acetylhexosaminidase [Oceaniferula flavus]
MHGQLLLLGVPGTELTAADAELYQAIQPGGFVIFGRNVASPEQLRKLTDDLREVVHETPIIAIDQEGGRVTRTRDIGAEPPSAQELREKGDLGAIARHGMITADLLRLLGINMDFAPVLDISYDDEADNALRGRCYGSDAQEVITNAGIFNRNLRHRKVLSSGKHFPSCGLADADPHHDLPHVHKSVTEMLKSDLLPYTALMPELDALMTCHAHFTAIDPDSPGLPGSMSHNLITRLLRDQLGYKGVVMTDDLDMGAILNTYGRGPDVKRAIAAGNDMAMICHQPETAHVAVEHLKELPNGTVDDALKRIAKLKKRLKDPFKFSMKLWDQLDAETMQLRIDVLGEEGAREIRDYSGVKRSPVEDY